MKEKRGLPNDGGSWNCARIIRSEKLWRRCDLPATHLEWDTSADSGMPICWDHDDFCEDDESP